MADFEIESRFHCYTARFVAIDRQASTWNSNLDGLGHGRTWRPAHSASGLNGRLRLVGPPAAPAHTCWKLGREIEFRTGALPSSDRHSCRSQPKVETSSQLVSRPPNSTPNGTGFQWGRSPDLPSPQAAQFKFQVNPATGRGRAIRGRNRVKRVALDRAAWRRDSGGRKYGSEFEGSG